MNEPILGKNEPHGFDYKPITWEDFLKIRNAAQIAANNIGYPVYLVGSALSKPIPRDIDISVIIPIDKYEEMFGKLPNDMDKFESYLTNVFNTSFDIISELHVCLMSTHHLDIKVCPDTWWKEKDKMLLVEPNNN